MDRIIPFEQVGALKAEAFFRTVVGLPNVVPVGRVLPAHSDFQLTTANRIYCCKCAPSKERKYLSWTNKNLGVKLRILKPYGSRKYKSHVSWSKSPARKLVIFVHGFKGDSLSTWEHFPEMINRKEFADCDVIFFGHSGGRRPIVAPVAQLFQLVDETWSKPFEHPLFPKRRGRQSSYEKVVLCGHSLGCVLIRDALLKAADQNKPWSAKSDMILFAPVHNGASELLVLMESFFYTGIALLQRPTNLVIKFLYPVVEHLRPDSQYLRDLKRRSEGRIEMGPKRAAVAKIIVHGEDDRIIELSARFVADPEPPIFIPGAGHKSVCKPRPRLFEDPYKHVVAGMAED
jgi:pimeloyl-ACP methyl ester carboxylesterase